MNGGTVIFLSIMSGVVTVLGESLFAAALGELVWENTESFMF